MGRTGFMSARSDFYSRPCGRGDPHRQPCPDQERDFYSRPCGRGDKCRASDCEWDAEFLLTPLREGRLCLDCCAVLFQRISTHAPAGGATNIVDLDSLPVVLISTHAPAGGATVVSLRQRGLCLISTHAPAGGATQLPCKQIFSVCHFYSRPCGRGDPGSGTVSVHVPLFLLTPLREGRQRTDGHISVMVLQFLLTPLREGRRRSSKILPTTSKFLLTPLREGRPAGLWSCS